jgi:hypothetical protein
MRVEATCRRQNASHSLPAVFALQFTNPTPRSVRFPKLNKIAKERKVLMDRNFPKQYDDSERRFLKTQAQELRNSNQPCELHTRTQGSLYRGRVLEADEGGIVFQQEDGRRVAVPISLVEKFVGIPISWGQTAGDSMARGAAAGSGSAY